jgi:ribosomal-protein-alanine N-acetyltransferase
MVLTNGSGRKIVPPGAAASLYEREEKLLIRTERLLLRRWKEEDREPFYQLNSDPRVMEFMPACLSPAESDALVDRITQHFREHEFGLFAAELREERTFIGFVGLAVASFAASFTPCVEIGWRLSAVHWGRGLATEGARAVVKFAFGELGLDDIVSFTVPENVRSRRVMEKIGMTHDASEDFDHPRLPEWHPLRRHVLYRLRRTDRC